MPLFTPPQPKTLSPTFVCCESITYNTQTLRRGYCRRHSSPRGPNPRQKPLPSGKATSYSQGQHFFFWSALQGQIWIDLRPRLCPQAASKCRLSFGSGSLRSRCQEKAGPERRFRDHHRQCSLRLQDVSLRPSTQRREVRGCLQRARDSHSMAVSLVDSLGISAPNSAEKPISV